MIDSHSHIFDTAFDDDRLQAITRATERGVELSILPAIDSGSHQQLIDTLATFPTECRGAIGLHPTSINENSDWQRELNIVEEYLKNPPQEWVAIGEVGLDLYWSQDFLTEQTQAFIRQIELSIAYDLPLIIHTRQAWPEVLDIVEKYAAQARGVFHSFSGTLQDWQRIEPLNFSVGIGGPVTYKTSTLPDIIPNIPIERILLETDAPYLPPVPYRGRRNESSYLEIIAQRIAQIKDLSVEQVKEITTKNSKKLFGL